MITKNKSRRGAVAALAMIYLMLFGTLTLAMFSMATLAFVNFSMVVAYFLMFVCGAME